MGSVGVILFLLVAAGLIFFFGGNQISAAWDAFQANQQNTNTANQEKLTPKAGQTVCDLKFVVYPYLEAPGFDVTLSAILGNSGLFSTNPHPEVASYQWLNCHTYGKLDLVEMNVALMRALDFIILPSGQTIHFNLVFVAGNGQQISSSTPGYSYLSQSVVIPAGIVGVPVTKQLNYYISSIPKESYDVQISSDIPINGMAAGSPYVYKVQP